MRALAPVEVERKMCVQVPDEAEDDTCVYVP